MFLQILSYCATHYVKRAQQPMSTAKRELNHVGSESESESELANRQKQLQYHCIGCLCATFHFLKKAMFQQKKCKYYDKI